MTDSGSRHEKAIAKFLVVRGDNCMACGLCARTCPEGVHIREPGFNEMSTPLSHLCPGSSCAERSDSCVAVCPRRNLSVLRDPQYELLGDKRWTPDIISAVMHMAETGAPPPGVGYRTGDSGDGFDRLKLAVPDWALDESRMDPGDAAPPDLGVSLNRRGEGPSIRIPVPFYGGGMSYGSISTGVMKARARACAAFGTFTCTGEGGYPDELFPYSKHVITQVATGLFGVSEDTIRRAPIVEFKYAQGAKPGLGGHLLGSKVTPEVARIRESVEGVSLFSPFPFHSVYSVEDHKKHLDWIRSINPDALISVKVSSPRDIDMVAVGSYYAGAHIIHIDGGYGGTGAAPDIAKKNIAMPIEYAIPKAHRFLEQEGIRDRVTLAASGGIRTPFDIIKIIALGADVAVLGTADLVALECVRCGNCEKGRGCPRGIATTDPELRTLVDEDWGALRITNMYAAFKKEISSILRAFGLDSISAARGNFPLLHHPSYPGRRNS